MSQEAIDWMQTPGTEMFLEDLQTDSPCDIDQANQYATWLFKVLYVQIEDKQ